jgi:hypothetical protein
MPSNDPLPDFGTAVQAAPNGSVDIDSLAEGDAIGAEEGAEAEVGADEAPGDALAPPPQAARTSGKAMAAVSAANFAVREVADMKVLLRGW